LGNNILDAALDRSAPRRLLKISLPNLGGIEKVADREYHTIVPEYGQPDVYHDHKDCREGKKIKPEHITWGRGTGRRLCEVCQRMP
jgi:hypothetical protein